MGVFIKKIISFFIFSVIFYIIFICICGDYAPISLKKNLKYKRGSYGYTYTRLEEVKKKQDIDILFIGSSHAYRGFDTRFFLKNKFNSFNLGSSSQTLIQTELLLKRYLECLSPKVVVIEVNPDSFSNDGVESSLDLIANDKNDLLSVIMAIKINHLTTYNTLIYGIYKDLISVDTQYIEKKNKEDTYIKNGFVEKKLSYFNGVYDYEYNWDYKPFQVTSFNNILLILKEENIKYYLVQAPISKAKYHLQYNKREFDEFMATKGNYYNFNKQSQLIDTLHFYDSHHLNQRGVEVFNKNLLS